MPRKVKNLPPPTVQHIVPPLHVKTSGCGWTADPRNLAQAAAREVLAGRFGHAPEDLSAEQFAALMADGWCGNCLHYCFNVGDWVPERQFVCEEYGE
jgi:hypothetical protein